MRVHRRHHVTTVAAVVLILVLTVTFVVVAAGQISGIDPDRRALEADEARLGLNPQMGNNATAITAGLMLAVCVPALGTAIGIVRRRQGARLAAMGLFGMLGVLSLAAGLGGLTSSQPAPNAWLGLLCGLADMTVVGLLLAPATADDFERAEQERQWLHARGYPMAFDR